ncbi:hypothetical protein CPSG_04299 [Coccidioides posadasii str. Silveira]|uniref:Uncharacterized protein n=1 Tax=Coccidioides posadasii (strain RMSCC 757 / Silveira) TaxID=443226 RepID=E9D3W0_COCPS|nr:hypothetical protein CPSG_04299 [Coccidioides posadasii str. Silveira]
MMTASTNIDTAIRTCICQNVPVDKLFSAPDNRLPNRIPNAVATHAIPIHVPTTFLSGHTWGITAGTSTASGTIKVPSNTVQITSNVMFVIPNHPNNKTADTEINTSSASGTLNFQIISTARTSPSTIDELMIMS